MLLIEHFYTVVFFKKLNPHRVVALQLRLPTPPKKNDNSKKGTRSSVLIAQGRKGTGMSPFHHTCTVTACADTGIHEKKGGFGYLLKQVI